MGKKIILFADGTGNAFSTQESNVWRLFDALDTSKKDQIAFYIEGVGTSSFRPWAIVDGATGFGAPENIRKLYRFLCWNWVAGDEIYMFGFSRGAFSVRTLIALIESEGLIPTTIDGNIVTQAEMERNSEAAWRAYRAKCTPSAELGLPVVGRAVRDVTLWAWHGALRHRPYDQPLWKRAAKAMKLGHWIPAVNKDTDDTVVKKRPKERDGENVEIKFAGLFDTVEAFGVPLEELRRAIDKLIWPISFPIDNITKRVRYVRHALSIDDERTTFHPIRIKKPVVEKKKELWRENQYVKNALANPSVKAVLARCGVSVSPQGPANAPAQAEDKTAASEDKYEPDVKEVWFAGVHSDIGGGYPDDQLAHIPLVWMMEEIRKTDNEYAEKNGKEDEKDAPGLRFRPGAEEEFRSGCSPFGTLHDSRGGRGFFYRYNPRTVDKVDGAEVVVHHTVIKRIVGGSDNYSPIKLPFDAMVLGADGQQHELCDYIKERDSKAPKEEARYNYHKDHVSDLVFARQFNYFFLLGLLLGFATVPLWEGLINSSRDAAINFWKGLGQESCKRRNLVERRFALPKAGHRIRKD